jgi:hypothetical protein
MRHHTLLHLFMLSLKSQQHKLYLLIHLGIVVPYGNMCRARHVSKSDEIAQGYVAVDFCMALEEFAAIRSPWRP